MAEKLLAHVASGSDARRFDIVIRMSEPTPIAVPDQLKALDRAVPGLVGALRDARLAGENAGSLDEREIELVRIALLVGLGAPAASFAAHVPRALAAGATATDVWSAVAAIVTLVGIPAVLEASPHISTALDEAASLE